MGFKMDDALKKRLKELALSGAISGGVLGVAGSALGAPSLGKILRSGAIGAAAGGGLATASGFAGGKVLGEPEEGEENAHTKRGAVGGAVAGGVLGALAGGISTSTKARQLFHLIKNPTVRKAFSSKDADGKVTNYLLEKLKNINSPMVGAGLGAAALGGAAAYQGADEGMQMDVVEGVRRAKKRREMLEAMSS